MPNVAVLLVSVRQILAKKRAPEKTAQICKAAGNHRHDPTQTRKLMELQPDDLKRLARLARIAVSDQDIPKIGNQLNGILGLIDELQAVDTMGVEPLAHPLDVIESMSQRLREDRVTESDARDSNMANAPAQEAGLFLVPKVIE